MGDWAHRFGASPLMRMTASWSWSAWTDRIQVRGAMLRPWAGSPQFVVADPTKCALSWRSDRTRWRQETGGKVVDRKSPIQAGKVEELSAAPLGFERQAARAVVPLTGFYLFRAFQALRESADVQPIRWAA